MYAVLFRPFELVVPECYDRGLSCDRCEGCKIEGFLYLSSEYDSYKAVAVTGKPAAVCLIIVKFPW